MPRVTIKTGFVTPQGEEEVLSEYLCDWTDCPNVAEHVAGVVRDLALACVLCKEHAAVLTQPRSSSDSR